jgi:hypothetical protein
MQVPGQLADLAGGKTDPARAIRGGLEIDFGERIVDDADAYFRTRRETAPLDPEAAVTIAGHRDRRRRILALAGGRPGRRHRLADTVGMAGQIRAVAELGGPGQVGIGQLAGHNTAPARIARPAIG